MVGMSPLAVRALAALLALSAWAGDGPAPAVFTGASSADLVPAPDRANPTRFPSPRLRAARVDLGQVKTLRDAATQGVPVHARLNLFEGLDL